jgi:hypothetical protein
MIGYITVIELIEIILQIEIGRFRWIFFQKREYNFKNISEFDLSQCELILAGISYRKKGGF